MSSKKKNNKKIIIKYLLWGRGRRRIGNDECHEFRGTLIHDHSTNPTKPNKTARAMPTAKCIPPLTVLTPDEVPFEPDDAEPVDDDVAPDAVPDPEADVLELEVEKFGTGSAETLVQVPPIRRKKKGV